MNNIEKYKNCFIQVFELTGDADVESLTYQSIPVWDSVGHMGLMAALEDTFDIMLETDDIIDFASFEVGVKTLEKYGVDLSK
ncbi:MAG: acyl carrier protein [Synergistaceae bacterium]|nr:acyl carrier protein [Synergistaceae bacterium]